MTETKGVRASAKPNLMAATWTKASKIRRIFKAGRPRQSDLVLSPTKAVLEGCAVLHELRTKMSEAGLSEDDAQAALVFVSDAGTHDLIQVFPIPPVEGVPGLYGKAKKLGEGWRPLGIILWQMDREAADPKVQDSGAVIWAQPWLADQRSARALLAARDKAASLEEGRYEFD